MIIGGQSILLCPPLDVNAERMMFMADIIAVLILLISRVYRKSKKKRREMHRLSGRRKLPEQWENAEKEIGWPCDR